MLSLAVTILDEEMIDGGEQIEINQKLFDQYI